MINEQIRDREVRLIGPDGEQIGVVSSREAQKIADEAGLDLVKIAPNAKPPVCKVIDYGKYRYDLARKEKDAKKKQKTVELKEIRLSPNIDTNDLNTKMNAAKKFLAKGNKVKITLRFRGREMAHFLTKQLLHPIERLAENMEDTIEEPVYKELVPFVNTIRKQHENILMAAKVRQDFTANVSHELKTPLTAISGYAELIENHMVDPEQETRFAQEIQQNATRLLSLINDIIRLSELDSGEDNLLCFEQVDLDEVAGTCVKNLQMNAQKRNVTLYYEGVSCMLRADRGMISELVENLCQNAIRYNNEGGEVHVRVYYEKGQPMLSVADNGIGIPKDQQERIFERFYRVDKSRSKQTGGTGLGLAIVKHIVELHDAVLHLESEPGKGTTITVAF